MQVKHQFGRILLGLLSFIVVMFALAKLGHAGQIPVQSTKNAVHQPVPITLRA